MTSRASPEPGAKTWVPGPTLAPRVWPGLSVLVCPMDTCILGRTAQKPGWDGQQGAGVGGGGCAWLLRKWVGPKVAPGGFGSGTCPSVLRSLAK